MDYRKVLGDKVFKGLYKFTCVRNPWERMISLYFYKSGKGRFNGWSRDSFIELVKGSRPAMKYLTTKGGGRLAKVLPRQQRWKRIFGIKPEVDFIIRFENLQSDFDKLCENIGISKVMLPHKNTSKRKNYIDYYDDELIEIVKELFIDDIQEFGYRFSLSSMN
jgi:chondroitin 4-sulfotransferase 11